RACPIRALRRPAPWPSPSGAASRSSALARAITATRGETRSRTSSRTSPSRGRRETAPRFGCKKASPSAKRFAGASPAPSTIGRRQRRSCSAASSSVSRCRSTSSDRASRCSRAQTRRRSPSPRSRASFATTRRWWRPSAGKRRCRDSSPSFATARIRIRRSPRPAKSTSKGGTRSGERTWPHARPSLLGLGAAHEAPREADRLRDLRDRSRLAQLLLARGHAPGAIEELDKIELSHAPVSNARWDRATGDPSVRWLRGRALEEVGRRDEADPLMGDPAQVFSSYGPWWATRGRWARIRGEEPVALGSFSEAVAADPFGAEGACEALDPGPPPAAASSPLAPSAVVPQKDRANGGPNGANEASVDLCAA